MRCESCELEKDDDEDMRRFTSAYVDYMMCEQCYDNIKECERLIKLAENMKYQNEIKEMPKINLKRYKR